MQHEIQYRYSIRFCSKEGKEPESGCTVLLTWNAPIQRGETLLLSPSSILEKAKGVLIKGHVPLWIDKQDAWKVDGIVHFPSTFGGNPKYLYVSPTKRPLG